MARAILKRLPRLAALLFVVAANDEEQELLRAARLFAWQRGDTSCDGGACDAAQAGGDGRRLASPADPAVARGRRRRMRRERRRVRDVRRRPRRCDESAAARARGSIVRVTCIHHIRTAPLALARAPPPRASSAPRGARRRLRRGDREERGRPRGGLRGVVRALLLRRRRRGRHAGRDEHARGRRGRAPVREPLARLDAARGLRDRVPLPARPDQGLGRAAHRADEVRRARCGSPTRRARTSATT